MPEQCRQISMESCGSKKEMTSEKMLNDLNEICEKIENFKPEADDFNHYEYHFKEFEEYMEKGQTEQAHEELKEMQLSFEYLKGVANNPDKIQEFYGRLMDKYREQGYEDEVIEDLMKHCYEDREIFFEKAKILYASFRKCLDSYLELLDDEYLTNPKISFYIKTLDQEALSREVEKRKEVTA